MLIRSASSFGYSQTFEIVSGGFATPYHLSSVPGTLSGCVYRADGAMVDASERKGGHYGDLMVSGNPPQLDRPEGMRPLAGRGVYLGNYMSHYGHFIFETLSTSWVFQELDPSSFDYFLFHPFVFGTRLPAHALFCFERLGIDPSRIVFVGPEGTSFDELVVPERLTRINHSGDPRLAWVYSRITEAAALPEPPCRRLYVSRRRFAARNFRRVVANEVRVEALFRQAGFEVLYPEAMTFPEQIAALRNAAVVAGISGSNLFNVLFAPKDTLLIEIGDPRYKGNPNPCQTVCNAIVGARGHFIPFKGKVFGPRLTMLADLDYLAEKLDTLLRAELAGFDAPPLAAPPRAARDLMEIGYRSIRPNAGHVLRRAFKKKPR
ncbi:hypothetical protein BH23PSE1_BH23PSE1_01180 [soil metagenome]